MMTTMQKTPPKENNGVLVGEPGYLGTLGGNGGTNVILSESFVSSN